MKPKPTAGIIGTGLIGASVGLALRAAGWTVIGFDTDTDTLHAAFSRGALDRVTDVEDLQRSTDLVVVAVSPQAAPEVLQSLDTAALVTDVTGVKAQVLAAGRHLHRFVSGHPMAGRETSGPEGASALLFRGATWVVITDGAADEHIATLEAIVADLGARPVRMSGIEHDEMVTVASHLPMVLASVLIAHASGTLADLSTVAGGFRDMTRVAASNPEMWTDLLAENRESVVTTIESFIMRLRRWSHLIDTADSAALCEALSAANRAQQSLFGSSHVIEVALPDRPGMLAAVGRALEAAGADVSDMHFRHTSDTTAVLRLFIENDPDALCTALAAEELDAVRA